MQTFGKGMGGVDEQADLMFAAEQFHGSLVHSAIDAQTMLQAELLLTRLRAVVIRLASLFQHLSRLAALCGSAEYQDHTQRPIR